MKRARELKPIELRWQCNPNLLKFRHLKDVEACEWIIGQPRAIEAIKLGLRVRYPGYNIFITGPVGTGRTTTITRLLEEFKVKSELKDLLYVNNFKNPDMPRLIELPAGKGRKFQVAMEKLIDGLKAHIPEIFQSEEYQTRRKKILDKYGQRHQALLRNFEKEVEAQGFKLVQIQMGPFVRPAILPIIDGKPKNQEELEALIKEGKLSQQDFEQIKKKIQDLETDMAKIYTQVREIQEAANEELERLNEWMVKPVVAHLIGELKKKFTDAKAHQYLDDVLEAILMNLTRFLKKDTKDEFREFKVNVVVDNSETKGAPVIFETTPSYKNLFGTIERRPVGPGVYVSDFLNIKAGSLLRANGGYLVLNAFDALIEPGVWQTLKRTLRNGLIDIQSFDPFYILTTTAMKPEPITINVKVVMIGSQWLYYLLFYRDEDFKKIFKVKADFDTVMENNTQNINQYASFIKSLCERESLCHLTKSAIADVIEYSVR
ncbi:hypothetical protein BXT86_06815, partial [candidate division WOR-3 bacterium 4484_100]